MLAMRMLAQKKRVVLCTLVLVLGLALAAQPADWVIGDGDTETDIYINAGDSVTMTGGTVTGDIYVYGGSLTITGGTVGNMIQSPYRGGSVTVYGTDFEVDGNPVGDSWEDYTEDWPPDWPTVNAAMKLSWTPGGNASLAVTYVNESSTVLKFSVLPDYAITLIRVDTSVTPPPGPIEVEIAVPGSLNINGHGVIPVTIFGSGELDVAEIDVSSLSFNGLAVRVKGKGLYHCAISDANEDGYPDLLCKFADDPEKWVPGQTTAKLTGSLNDGTEILGTTEIRVVNE